MVLQEKYYIDECVCNEKVENKRIKIYVLKHSLNLFGTEVRDLFNLWNTPIVILSTKIVALRDRKI